MIKEQIVKHLLDQLEEKLKVAQTNYNTTKVLLHQGDLKPDGKYDTRSTEANYLADGQRMRIKELKDEMHLLKDVNLTQSKDKTIKIGSLVKLEHNGIIKSYFLCPTSGGKMINIKGQIYMAVSAFSPIGDAMLSLEKGDEFELDHQGNARHYIIADVK